ncbi:hypothetical protein [Sphingobacterium sp. 1.A.5]|uniref:hypothetical protein n=1 Tax=Sphingobacterium sp. 1.A.5 TaxID=2044604 RepID=UPI000C0BD5B9|nr:hypothetical protein [Sphingobacterium sp. 1.A.5]
MEKLSIDYNIIKNIKQQLRINNVVEVEILNCMSKIYKKIKNIEFSTELTIEVNNRIRLVFGLDKTNRYNNWIYNVKVISSQ